MYTEDDNLKTDNRTVAERHDVTPQKEQAQELVDQALKSDQLEKEEPQFEEVAGEEEQANEQRELLDHWGNPTDAK